MFSDDTGLGGSAVLLESRKAFQKGTDISIDRLRPYV